MFSGVLEDIYELRVRALDERVSDKELARILIHLAQRRGFKSNRKSEAKDKEGGKLLKAVEGNREAMKEQGFRTVGEMFYRDERFADGKRNKGGGYLTVVHRDMVISEAEKIIEAQRRLGNEKLTEAFEEKYLDILKSQRQFDEGPGYPSPAAGNQIEKMIGSCTFEPGEKRAAKACFSFEYFNLLQKINHIRLSEWDGSVRGLNAEERQMLTTLCRAKESVDFLQIRKELGLGEYTAFNIRYEDDKDPLETEKKTKFCFLKFYHQVRKALNGVKKNRIDDYSLETLDEIGRILTVFKGDDSRREKLAGLNIAEEDIEALLGIGSVSKFSNLSLKALRKIIPYLKEGLSYDKACEAAGYNFRGHDNGEKSFLLPAEAPETEDITNPVVRRAVAQTIKVVNAVIRERDESPLYINIELARELSKTFEERRDIEKENKENRAKNDRIVEELKETYGVENPTGSDILKLKLYREQKGICVYSGKPFDLHRLFEPGYAEIDHIIPHSISFDDSYNNKALVLAFANQNKGDRLPWQYIHDDLGVDAADAFEIRVKNAAGLSGVKRQRLLKKQLTDEDIDGFKERNLQDTKYLSRFILNYINDHLRFAPSESGRVKRVTAVKGAVTAYLRKRWGISKNRSNGDRHHAADAAVIACTTDSLIQKASHWSKKRERQGCDGVKADKRFPAPWQSFRRELEIRVWGDESEFASLRELNPYYYGDIDISQLQPVFVSRMPKRKVTGQAHLETVKGVKASEPGLLICKRDIKKLKLDADGEIADYYNRSSDRLLYEALKARLQAFGGSGEKAFAEPFYKPKADGSRGPLVKKVKVCEKSTLNVPVQQNTAAADNGSMVRVDVFRITEGKDKGYYLVPIYVSDTIKTELPNRAIVAAKPYEEWKEMDDKDFVFSLYPNDLIKISHKKSIKFTKTDKDSTLPACYETKEKLVYYKGTNISSATVTIINHDNTYKVDSCGVKTLECIEKYQVDVLGNYHNVKGEPRRSFSIKRKG